VSKGKARILALGASATAGTPGFFSPRERPPDGQGNPQSQYAYWIMQKCPQWEILNRGMRGQRTDQILSRFAYDVLDNYPQGVIILAGSNDLYQGYDCAHALDNLLTMFKAAQRANIWVIACSLLPLDFADHELKSRIVDFNVSLRETASELKIGFCDLYEAMEDPEHRGFLRTSPDQVHPDVAGYRRMGETLVPLIEKQLSPE